MVHSDNETELLSHEQIWRKRTSVTLGERSQYEEAIYYMMFWKKQNHGDNKKISGCQKLLGREW